MRSLVLPRIFLYLFSLSLLIPCFCCGGSDTVVFNASLGVYLDPQTATVAVSQTQQFTASPQNSSSGVTWSVDEGDSFGTINSSGLYTAPATVPTGSTATVRVMLVQNTQYQATAVVTITP